MPDIFTANKPAPQQDNEQPADHPVQPQQPQSQPVQQNQQWQPQSQQPMQNAQFQQQQQPQTQMKQPQNQHQPPEQHNQPEQPAKPAQKRLSTSLPVSDEGSSPGLFSSYCVYPKGITFINQEEGERLLLFLRRHFITNVPWIIMTILGLLVPPILNGIFVITNFEPFAIPPQMTFVIIVFYYLFILNYALSKFIVWFYHVGIVTPKRLIDLDVDNILTYHLAETEMRDIVDVSYSEKGFFQSFFNFGNVPIQTEAIKANFEFEETPNPAQVADIITDLRPHGKGEH